MSGDYADACTSRCRDKYLGSRVRRTEDAEDTTPPTGGNSGDNFRHAVPHVRASAPPGHKVHTSPARAVQRVGSGAEPRRAR